MMLLGYKLKLNLQPIMLMVILIILDLLYLSQAIQENNCFLIPLIFRILNEHLPMIFYSNMCIQVLNMQSRLDPHLASALRYIKRLLKTQIFYQNYSKFQL
jgi:DNA replication protein DnaC